LSDQAETLRKLMHGRVPAEFGDNRGPSIITLTECGEPGNCLDGLRALQAGLGFSFTAAGFRALLVDYGGAQASEQSSFEDLSENQPQTGKGPWFAPIDANGSDSTERRGRLVLELERSYPAVDVILVTAYSRVGLLPVSLYGPARANTLLVGPGPESLDEAVYIIRELRKTAGVLRTDLIVKQVSTAAEARKVHAALKAKLGRFIDAEIEYLGFFLCEKKFLHTVRKPEFLVNLNQESRLNAAVEMLSKRLQEKYLNLGDAKSVRKVVERPLRQGRFQEEPARIAPGNLAGFWRTLLGEVKA